MVDKHFTSVAEAVADITDGATIMVGGFGPAGQPTTLLAALTDRGLNNLTIISNNAGNGESGLAGLLKAGCVRKIICSFPRQADSWVFDDLWQRGQIELELVPQGTLAARIQAGGNGLGGIFTPTGYGTELVQSKEVREIAGRHYVFELPLKADYALISAAKGDRWGNLIYNKAARNFGPIMAMAARITLAEVNQMVPLGSLDAEAVITPGIFTQRLVIAQPATENIRKSI